MSPCICIAEELYLRLHFLECTVVIGGPGGGGDGGGGGGARVEQMPPTSLFFAVRCLKETRPHTPQEAVTSGACWESLITISGSRKEPRPGEKTLIVTGALKKRNFLSPNVSVKLFLHAHA